MDGTFKLEITLGNDAVQTKRDIAGLLRKVIKKLESGEDYGAVMDDNGNRVGEWELQREGGN